MAACAFAFAFTLGAQAAGQQTKHITTPKEALGFVPGDDYRLANYTQLAAWWRKLATESDRAKLVEIGKTEEGRPQYMMIISSPENMKNLDKYQGIVRKLALAEGITDAEAHALAKEGKSVIWIDGGLHASEIVNCHQLMMLVYEMLTKDDEETTKILNNVILLAVQSNPDGQELVSNWYMRKQDINKRSYDDLPKLYNKYVGHDDNRDFFMANMKETTNMLNVLFRQWFPQVMYNHHQTGPAGAVIAMPPFRDPFNFNYDPIIMTELELVGAAMRTRFAVEGKGGFSSGNTVMYSTWNNGMQRTITYFHNIVGILTEIIGNPTPQDVPLVPDRQRASVGAPLPIPPTLGTQKWHFRQSIDYSLSADRAILTLAADNKEMLMYNQYVMGRNSIQRGSKDSWTVTPKRIEALKAAGTEGAPARENDVFNYWSAGVDRNLYNTVLHDPKLRDPRGYIIPSDQADFATATKFINTLIKNGVTVMKATAAFNVAGKQYPAGSYVVKTAQAFRPHIIDMFEPQDHPNDFQYPGGPPIPPYDITGWTLAFQMGVQFDRILDGFNGPFQKLADVQNPVAGKVSGVTQAAGYLISHQLNDSTIVVNRLLKAGAQVYWLKGPATVNGKQQGPGTIWAPASTAVTGVIQKSTALGVSAEAVSSRPSGDMMQLKPVRIGLWDQYGGSMPSGWLRWLFEKYEFTFEVIYPQTIDAGNLAGRFDVIILPPGAFPAQPPRQPGVDELPAEYKNRLGSLTAAKSIPQLRTFAEAGGSIIGIGDSSRLGLMLGLPMTDGLTETAEGRERRLPTTKFYIPGAILRASVDNNDPVAYGMPSDVDIFFQNGQAYKLGGSGLKQLLSFPNAEPLRSGWAFGQAALEKKVEAVSANVGEGHVYMFGFEPTFRGEPYATFKLLFNAIYAGKAK